MSQVITALKISFGKHLAGVCKQLFEGMKFPCYIPFWGQSMASARSPGCSSERKSPVKVVYLSESHLSAKLVLSRKIYCAMFCICFMWPHKIITLHNCYTWQRNIEGMTWHGDKHCPRYHHKNREKAIVFYPGSFRLCFASGSFIQKALQKMHPKKYSEVGISAANLTPLGI